MSAHPARPRALIRIQPGALYAAAALAQCEPHSQHLAGRLWQLADQAWQTTRREEEWLRRSQESSSR